MFFLHQNPDCTKVSITDFDTDSTESSNLIFSVATGLVSAIIVSIDRPTIVKEFSIERFFLAIKSWYSGKPLNFPFFNHLEHENHVSPWLEAWFLPSKSQSEILTSGKTSSWQIVKFLPSNWNLMVRKIRKLLEFLIELDVPTQFYSNLHDWFDPSRSQLISFELWQISRKKVVESVPFTRIVVVPKFQKLILMMT